MLKYKKVCIAGMTGVSDENLYGYKTAVESLCPGAAVDILSKEILPEDELIERAKGYDVLMSGFQPMSDRVYAETDLVALIACSIGFDFADAEAAARHGVVVANNPAYCVEEVAEHIAALVLCCARGLWTMGNVVRRGGWGFPHIAPQNRAEGSTLGFFGFGRIPRRAAAKLSGISLRRIACDPYLTPEQTAGLGVALVSFEELLERSDYLVLQVPLTPATKGIFNAEAFRKMKSSACLINTARGPLVDQNSLYEALTAGELRMAALDVLEHEPPLPEERRLLELPNVICTGHTAFYSEQSLAEQQRLTVKNIARVLRGELPENVVNPGALKTSPLR